MESFDKIVAGFNEPIVKVEPTPMDDVRMSQVIHAGNRPIVYPPYSVTRFKTTKENPKEPKDTKPTE